MRKQILWEGMLRGKPYSLVSHGDVVCLEPLTEGVVSNIASKAWTFVKANPFLTTIVGLSALDALRKYNSNKEKTVKLTAKDKADKNRMQSVVDSMVKSGYKIVKQSYKGADGYEWEVISK